MQSALSEFEESLKRVRHLHGLHAAFEATLTAAVDLSDILRAELVMAVSALDRFVHDLTRLGMLECHSGARARTDAFNRFPVPMASLAAVSAANTASNALEAEIRTKHSHLSFQHPDKIAEAVRLFSGVSLWEAVGGSMGMTGKDAKATLGLIVDRRNKIAHEADTDPSFPGQLWPIDRTMVEGMVSTIEAIGRAIHAACA